MLEWVKGLEYATYSRTNCFDPTRVKERSRNLGDTFSDKQFHLGLIILKREQNKLMNEDGIQSTFILDVKNTNNAGENRIKTYINYTKIIMYYKD